MKNLDIRLEVSESGLKYKDIAKKMGVSDTWLSTLLRFDLSAQNHERIMKAIEELKGTEPGYGSRERSSDMIEGIDKIKKSEEYSVIIDLGEKIAMILQEEYTLHTTVVIQSDQVRIMQDETGYPVEMYS